MKSTIALKLQFANTALVAALAVAGSAVAQTLPKEGSYDMTTCFSGVSNLIAFSKTHFAYSYEMMGPQQSNPPGGMFDKMAVRCVGMNTSFGGINTSNVACEAIDRDGDKRLTNFAFGKDGTVIKEVIAGTGKYDGMVSEGQTIQLGPFPTVKAGTFQNCSRQTGTYKMK
jgi:hypothetical protein